MSVAVIGSGADAKVHGPASPRRRALRRFARHRLAVVGLLVVAVVAIVVVVLPAVMHLEPAAVDARALRRAPGNGHLLGTDSVGRDVFARLVHGGRTSLLVGIASALAATVIGLTLGTVAGYYGGWVDHAISRSIDVLLSFPSLIVVVFVVAIVGPSLRTLVLVIAFLEWPSAARLVRGETLSLREADSVLAVRGLGTSTLRLLRRHIVPALIGPLSVVSTLIVAQAILLEAGLSFLGLGVSATTASWGGMLNEAQSLTILETMPWLWLPPGIAIASIVLAVNFVGDGLRDAADPRELV